MMGWQVWESVCGQGRLRKRNSERLKQMCCQQRGLCVIIGIRHGWLVCIEGISIELFVMGFFYTNWSEKEIVTTIFMQFPFFLTTPPFPPNNNEQPCHCWIVMATLKDRVSDREFMRLNTTCCGIIGGILWNMDDEDGDVYSMKSEVMNVTIQKEQRQLNNGSFIRKKVNVVESLTRTYTSEPICKFSYLSYTQKLDAKERQHWLIIINEYLKLYSKINMFLAYF